MNPRRLQAFALTALLLAAACDRSATGAPDTDTARIGMAPGDRLLGSVTCHVNAITQETRCSGAIATSGGAHRARIALDSTHFALETGASFTSGGVAHFFNEIRNDLGQDIGTHDGIQADSIRAFVTAISVTGGSGSVTARNPAGTGTFTAPNQPYWEWNEIVMPGGSTSTQIWEFNVPGTVTAWSYTVGVSAPIAHPDGWVDVSGDTQIPHGNTRQHTAVVYDWTGAVDTAGVVTWSTSDGSGSAYAAPWNEREGTILGVRVGTATVTASKGAATPRTRAVDVY